MKWRDKYIYSLVFGRYLPTGMPADGAFGRPRNWSFRANNSMYETMGEVVAIWNGVALVWIWEVSLDGRSPVGVWQAIQTGLIQTLMEFLADVISLIGIKHTHGVDILAKSIG